MVVITNKEIYCKLLDIEKNMLLNNGKIKLIHWISTTSLTLVITLIFLILGGIL